MWPSGRSPEVPEHCEVAAAGNYPALLPARFCDPGELALPQRRIAHLGNVLCFETAQPGRRCPGTHAALEAMGLLAALVLHLYMVNPQDTECASFHEVAWDSRPPDRLRKQAIKYIATNRKLADIPMHA